MSRMTTSGLTKRSRGSITAAPRFTGADRLGRTQAFCGFLRGKAAQHARVLVALFAGCDRGRNMFHATFAPRSAQMSQRAVRRQSHAAAITRAVPRERIASERMLKRTPLRFS